MADSGPCALEPRADPSRTCRSESLPLVRVAGAGKPASATRPDVNDSDGGTRRVGDGADEPRRCPDDDAAAGTASSVPPRVPRQAASSVPSRREPGAGDVSALQATPIIAVMSRTLWCVIAPTAPSLDHLRSPVVRTGVPHAHWSARCAVPGTTDSSAHHRLQCARARRTPVESHIYCSVARCTDTA